MSDFLATATRVFRRGLTPALLGLLVLVVLARLALLANGGALAFPDEERYLESVKAIEQLVAGNLEQACLHLADTQGRPADGLLRLPVAALQVVWHQMGGPAPDTPVSLRLPQLMNYLVLLGNALLLYHLARRWQSKQLALMTVLVYAALASTNMYVRHLLPYDMALGIVLLALGHLTNPHSTVHPFRLGLATGLLSLLTVAVYPGYYFAPLLLGSLLLIRLPWRSWWKGFPGSLAGALALVLPLEALTRYGHISYLRSLQSISSTITQGDFTEGFSFIGKYLWQAEGVMGLLLLLTALPGAWLLARTQSPLAKSVMRTLGLLPLGLWLLHAILVYFAHSFVFYGRIVHFFIPFLVLYAVTAFAALPPSARRIGLAGLVIVTLGQFGQFLQQFLPLTYPRDILAAHNVQPKDSLTYLNESAVPHGWDFAPPPAATTRAAGSGASYVLINFTYPFWLSTESCGFVPPPTGARLVFDAPHFFSFPAYGFEGFNPAERAHLRACGFHCRLYQLRAMR
ncbi:hypothetical protein SAMN06265337_0204 [Hymenobacter gelipurpurascens]|uniref:Dolichyl-phosphate-mannose-protein mannosyltransferase n=1 Tax=Hymenobacter gelipurpurascens TaxID=89968 RepID=A0A212T2D5_9BACT|nr:hypothetical protein [Hymenobacter gelipurpurascens]SNC60175.1 hypothetical protein SAMN06265337_0204 [Hymenobacter gelipurpurascens]